MNQPEIGKEKSASETVDRHSFWSTLSFSEPFTVRHNIVICDIRKKLSKSGENLETCLKGPFLGPILYDC